MLQLLKSNFKKSNKQLKNKAYPKLITYHAQLEIIDKRLPEAQLVTWDGKG